MGEFELIDAHFKKLGSVVSGSVDLGIGDDCALVSVPRAKQLALSCDTLIEGVHFLPGTAAQQVGYRCLAVNLSDLAAMGAQPAWFTLCVTLVDHSAPWVERFCQGMNELCDQFPINLIGGDTTRGPRLSVTIQVFGLVDHNRALTRSGASVGDDIYVSGRLGEAGLGLLLAQSSGSGIDEADLAAAKARFDRPLPRLELGWQLLGRASACIDVSDGLLADLNHILVASGVGAELNVEAVPLAQALVKADSVLINQLPLPTEGARERRLWALAAGDDYELCFTAPRAQAAELNAIAAQLQLPITRIGKIVPGGGIVDSSNAHLPIEPRGYQHF